MSSIFFAVKTFQEFESETPRENPVFVKWAECLKFKCKNVESALSEKQYCRLF